MNNDTRPRRRFKPRIRGALNHFEQEIVKAVRGMSALDQAEVRRMITRYRQGGGAGCEVRTRSEGERPRRGGGRAPGKALLERFEECVHGCNSLPMLSRLCDHMVSVIETGRPLGQLEPGPRGQRRIRTIREARVRAMRLAPRLGVGFLERITERFERINSETA